MKVNDYKMIEPIRHFSVDFMSVIFFVSDPIIVMRNYSILSFLSLSFKI